MGNQQLVNGTEEFEFGQAAFLSRHPVILNWKLKHNFYLCTLEIAQIVVLDWYGGAHFVPVNEYYKSTVNEAVVHSKSWNDVEKNDATKFDDHHKGRHHLKIKINGKRDEIDIEI